MSKTKIKEYIDNNKDRYVNELIEICKIPGISALSQNLPDLYKSAEWYKKQLDELGFETEIYPADGNPILFAKRCPHKNAPTIIFYGHHDVQPVDPLDEWNSPPFEPVIKDGFLYARGAHDDKGQILTGVKGVEAVIKNEGELPVNVKFIIEGAEESGSRNFDRFLAEKRSELEADSLVILDTAQYAQGVPAITYALRGNIYMQIDVQGPAFDLHSGEFGGAAVNPVIALVQILDAMKAKDNKITIPGFYDNVVAPEEWERKEFASLPFDEEGMKDYLQVDTIKGEPGYTINESMMIRPTFDICGIWGGFAGEGSKTIIPAKAGAKISMRLVPDQDPDRIEKLVADYVNDIKPDGVTVKVIKIQGLKALFVDKNQPAYKAIHKAIKEVFGKDPVYIRCGGSIGIANLMKEKLGIDSILMTGWGTPEDNIHSPNEHQSLEDFHKGIHVVAEMLENLKGE